MQMLPESSAADHGDAIEPHHNFCQVAYRGHEWDLSHLRPFAFRCDIRRAPESLNVDVVVFFSCHCFTRAEGPPAALLSDYYDDGREVRILCEERYALSKQFLPRLVIELWNRHIRIASSKPNFVTIELIDNEGGATNYAVFFEVRKDTRRKKRLLLRVQSAYKIEAIKGQLAKAGKVNFDVLLRATYEGRKIKS